MISQSALQDLAQIIVKNLQEEFAVKKMSGNLIKTIQVDEQEGDIKIIIPARTYNMLLYQTKKVVVHTSHGSYASKLDEEGSSFMVYPYGTRKGSYRVSPGNHKGYVDSVIKKSLDEWVEKNGFVIANKGD